MGKLIGSITGANKVAKASKKAAELSRLQPFQVTGDLGSANVTETGVNVTGGIGSELANPFAQFAGGTLQQAGQQQVPSFFLDPNSAFFGAQQQNPQAQQFSQAGGDFLSQLQGFNPDQFATQQFERLNRLAAPAEQTAAAATANDLFTRGRLGGGDSVSGQVFRDLDLSQALQRDNRLLQSIGLANQQQQQLGGLASQFAGQGSQLQNDQINRFMQSIGAGTQVGAFQDQLRNSLLQQALAGTQGVSLAGQGQRDALQAALTGSSLSTNARTNAGQTLLGGAQVGAAAQGNFVGGALGALSPIKLPGLG